MKKISSSPYRVPGIVFVLGVVVVILWVVLQHLHGSKGSHSVLDRIWSEYDKTTVTLNDHTIEAVIADTEQKRVQGLSDTENLPEGTGMLFVFDEPAGIHSFWMKDMQYDLDILWLDIDGEIVYTVESATPASYPDTFTNTIPARYVLELPAGSCKKYTCTTGDSTYFSLN